MTIDNDPWAGIRQLQFRQQTVDHPAWNDGLGYSTNAWSDTAWGADQDTLNAGGYNSKYQLDQPEEVAPNVFRLRVQQPGAHKYDTADAFYAVDPTTGMGTLVEDPTPTREVSGREKWRDRLETRILPIVATILSAGYGSQALAGMGAAEGGAAAANLGVGGATAGDFGMMVGADGLATYGGVGAAEAMGAEAAAAAAAGSGAAGSGLLNLGTLPPVPPPLSPLSMTGASATMPFLEAVPAVGAGASLFSAAAPAVAAKGLLSGIDPTLLQLGGAALGAASSQDQEQTTTQKNEPWAPAQQWIKDNIASGQALQKQYAEHPFSPGQQTAYGNMYGLLNSFNTEMLPGLLGNANTMSQGYDRYAPKETRSKPKFGAVSSTWAPGLLKFGG